MDGKTKATVSEIEWTVTNISENEVAVTPYLMTDGLITVSDVRELPAFTLGAGSSTTVSVAAAELPIQSQIGSGTVSLYFVLAPTGDPERETAVHSRAFYFRHQKNYKKVKLFDESVLEDEYGGKLFEIPPAFATGSAAVGRTVGTDGEVHVVAADDEAFEVASEGTVMGRITGSGTMDVAIEDGEGASATSSVPLTPPPVSITWCFKWRLPNFVDNFGLLPAFPPQYAQASYAHATIKYKSSGAEMWSGYLNGSGCVTQPTLPNTDYVAILGTALSRNGRQIVVNPSWSDICNHARGFTRDVTSGGASGTLTLNYSSNTPETRLAVIARQPLVYYTDSQLEWPSVMTVINPSNSHNTSAWEPGYPCSGGGRIKIDTSFEDPSNPGVYMDHSNYRFIVAHEMGHRMAAENGGPLSTKAYIPSQYSNDSGNHPLNCSHFDEEYAFGCFQSMGLIGDHEAQGWAHFYAAALYNWSNRNSGNCQWKYWRALYDSSAEPIADPPNTAMPTWITTAPVAVSCKHNVRWMEQYSDDPSVTLTNRATDQDWVVFYWNVWSDGANRFSIDELTDIWHDVPSSTEYIADSDCDSVYGSPVDHICNIGETWEDLDDHVAGSYSIGKRDNFRNKGNFAGVDGTIF